jgi:hypothetical protein
MTLPTSTVLWERKKGQRIPYQSEERGNEAVPIYVIGREGVGASLTYIGDFMIGILPSLAIQK